MVSATPSPHAGVATMIVQPVVLNGRGQTAQAKTTTQTGREAIHKVVKSTLCLNRNLFGMDSQAPRHSSSYAKHVSIMLETSDRVALQDENSGE